MKSRQRRQAAIFKASRLIDILCSPLTQGRAETDRRKQEIYRIMRKHRLTLYQASAYTTSRRSPS